MDAKLVTAIDKWRKASYQDNSAFEKELEPLYKSLFEVTQVTLGKIDAPVQQQINDFLTEDSKLVDRCVRWHLLKLAIHNAGSMAGTGTREAHVQLAKTIMASEKEGWDLLFYSPTGKRMKTSCKWQQDGGKQEQTKQQRPKQQNKQQGKVLDAPAVAEASARTLSGMNRNPHLRTKQGDEMEKTLFAVALCEGHPFMGPLLAEAQKLCCCEQPEADELLHRRRIKEDFASLVRRNNKYLHEDIVKAHKTAGSALGDALRELPGILQDPAKLLENGKLLKNDKMLLDRVIEDPFLDLADIILASEDHRRHLTTRELIVKAIKNWMIAKCQQPRGALPSGNHHNQDDDDDSDDDDDDNNNDEHRHGGDDEKNRRDLAIRVLSHAPKDVLRSPEVLTEVMQNNLLDDADILDAYATDAEDDSKRSSVPSASFKHVASFLKGVRGILHMAVFYQQRPLVEALLRHNAQLAVIRAYVETTAAGGTIPNRKEKEASVETAATAVDAASGANGVPHDQKVQKVDSGYYPLWYNNNKANKAISSEVPDVQDKDSAAAQEQRSRALKQMRTWKQIRSALIYCTMKHAENVQTLLTILRESGEPENEINFDMSRLLIEGTSVADFVTSMPRHGRSYSLIRYEETIRYAEFPVLDLSTQPQTPAAQNQQRSHLQRTHTEVLDMLEWLAEHGVRRIITLRVPDRMAHPHDELEIAEVVRRFRVEELDWRILDLSLNIFQPHGEPEGIPFVCTVDKDKTMDNQTDKTGKIGKPGKTDKAKDEKNEKNNKTSEEKSVQETYLRRLHLYTGGRRSALDHWFSTEGLESIKLDHVYIHVIKELTTKKQSDATLQYINTKVAELKKRKKSMQIDVQSQFWTAQTETPRLQEIIHHLSPRLAQFIAYYRQRASICHEKHKGFQPAKVAIIDNGILSMDPPSAPRVAGPARPEDAPDVLSSGGENNNSSERHLHSQEFWKADNLWARICDGKSFVHEQDRVSPWYLASNPHGTQMANLVCAIDPLCQLYVAKIADSHYGYSAARAAAAVDWAVERGVDIISMSFTTTENHEAFNEAVRRAMKAGILVVCSHHDEGARIGTQVFPACLSGHDGGNALLRMASCNMYGKLQHDWDDNTTDDASKKINQYDFCINSQDVAVGAIPFLAASTERISGSSVATAIAAGVCSLLIACLRTLHKVSTNAHPDGNEPSGQAIFQIRNNVTGVLATRNRPTYADINTYLATMAPSTTNPRFISLDRFARLDELRDVNMPSLSNKFFALGAKFPGK